MANANGSLGGEPVAVLGALATVIVFVLANFDVVIDVSTVNSLLLAIWPLVGGLIARNYVTPVK